MGWSTRTPEMLAKFKVIARVMRKAGKSLTITEVAAKLKTTRQKALSALRAMHESGLLNREVVMRSMTRFDGTVADTPMSVWSLREIGTTVATSGAVVPTEV